MNKSIPERIFIWEDEMNDFLLGKRRQVQIGINQDPVRGLLTYVRMNAVTRPEVDLEKAAQHVYESWMGGTMDDVRRDMVELGKVLNARKEG